MRKFLRKYLPDADEIRSKRYISWFGGLLHHPNLWHLNRRSVAGAVAIGMFAGLIPGPLQMIGAALIAVPLKKNLPVALVTTFYTNPVTIVPLYVLAYGYGRLLLLWENHGEASIQPFEWDWANWLESTRAMFEWAVALGKPLAVGLVALALTLAALGYVAVQVGWRVYVMLAWRARCQRRAARS
ncbi:MAG TPA: DUF2062 domain-containing protein [Burkholderiales bacterium]|nr:DUF2062 domain-containing protein [Burkholderiales bacterium]